MQQLTKITLAWELFESGVPRNHIAKQLEIHRETVGIWITGIAEKGLKEFLDVYENAKRGERKGRQVDPILKRRRCTLNNLNGKNGVCSHIRCLYRPLNFLQPLFMYPNLDSYCTTIEKAV